MNIFGDWEHCVALSNELYDVDADLARIDESLTMLSEDNDKTLDGYTGQKQECQSKIELTLMQIDIAKLDLALLKRYEETVIGFDGMRQQFTQLQQETEAQYRLFVTVSEQESIEEFMRGKYSALGQIEHVLSKARIAEGIIRDMAIQKEEILIDGEAYALMVKELSPSDGLIADCMKGFITVFAQQMTDIIKNIWTHDFIVLPCKMGDSDELDYRFPMQIGMSLDHADDVSEGSASQVDVVDFAFRILTILYLGLESMPFYLDEPATTMDETHRSNIILFIKEYVDMQKASQLFLISHYFQQSGAFHPSETLLLDGTNIVNIPGVYNRHAVIKKI
jgi:wobble nucleotide-excising tRNase